MAHGDIAYIEMCSKDLAQTESFYQSLFGWKFQPAMGGNYQMFSDPSDQVGGGFSAEIPPIPNNCFYVTVDSIEKTLAQAAELGAAVQQDKKLIDDSIGWWASFKDPSDNIVGIFESATPQA